MIYAAIGINEDIIDMIIAISFTDLLSLPLD